MNKKLLIVVLGVSIIFIFSSILYVRTRLIHHWETDPEAICNGADGFWTIITSPSCSDLCANSISEYPCKDRPGHMGCSCGLDACWDGVKCIQLYQKPNN